MRLRPQTWMCISLLLFAASALMWHLGERRTAQHHAAPVLPHPVGAAQKPAAAPAQKPDASVVTAKAGSSYVLRNTTATLKQLERNDRAIILRNALIDTTHGTKLDIPAHLRSAGAPGKYIVQSPRALDAGFYARLSKDGATVVSYFPNDAALVTASPEAAKALASDTAFDAVMPYEPYYKLDAALLPEAVAQTPMTNNILRVTVYPGEAATAVQALTGLGANVMGQDPSPFGTTLVALVPPDKLVAVAQMPQAEDIEVYSGRRMMDDLGRAELGVANSPTNAKNYQGLTGTNIWVSVNDTGVDSTHPDFDPALSRLYFDSNSPVFLAGLKGDTNGHGTHVASIIAGDGTASTTVTNNIPGSGVPKAGQFRGMAPQANLFVQGTDPTTGPYVSDFYLQTNASYTLMTKTAGNTAGVTNGFVVNNSWGYNDTTYDIMAASYDAATRDSQPNYPGEQAMLFVFAAGDGFQQGGSITSPGTAKNVITVGAGQNPRSLTNLVTVPGQTNIEAWYADTSGSNNAAALTSAGNVDVGVEGPGGRFKPDLIAPGVFVVGARSANYVDESELQVTQFYYALGQDLPPGQMQAYSITFPANTTNLIIQASPNAQSPVPFPTDLQFYYGTNFPLTLITVSNEAGLPIVVGPEGTNGFIGVDDPAADAQPVAYDLHAWAITNGAYGTYFSVLSNLNSAFGPTKKYRYESGTSMAAAAVTGMIADMQQFLVSQLNMNPSPALLKALLINGARTLNSSSDLNPATLGNVAGWGLPNLSNSVPASLTGINPSMVMIDQSPTNALATGQWHNYQVSITDTNATNFPLRVTLVWTDPPGNPAAGIALVNNLDLMVADNTGTNLFIGNDFPTGGGEAGVFTQPSPTNSVDAADVVNNVENVFLDSSQGLQSQYFISVRGTRVSVNAVTGQTTNVLQDYALVVSSDDQTPVSGLTVTDMGVSTAPPTNFAIVQSWTNANAVPPVPVTVIGNGVAQIHQRVGGNEPGLWNPVFGGTNGNPLQWHFFVLSNSVTGTNASDTNAIFATFLPPSLTLASSDPANMSLPANNDADIDLYVSTDAGLTNLDATAVANSVKSLGQGGNEFVVITNATPNEVFYAGVKSETQQGADFGFFAEITGPLNTQNPDGSVTAMGSPLPVGIPDYTAGGQGTNVFAFVTDTSPNVTMARKLVVGVGLNHANPADLVGTIMAGDTTATLNNNTASDATEFTNFYDDLPDGSISNAVPTDAPGTLRSFVGQPMTQMYRLNETDTAPLQAGNIEFMEVTVWPQPANPLNFLITSISPNGWYYGFVDTPTDTTNLNIEIGFNNGGPLSIFMDNQDDVNMTDYGIEDVGPPGGALDDPNSALDVNGFPVNTALAPGLGGRIFYGIYNENGTTAVTNIQVVITISESLTPNLTLTQASTAPIALQTGAHTQAQICITDGLLTNNVSLVGVQVGVRLDDTNLDDLVLHLISPQGTSVELFEDRGGTSATGLGLTVTNAGATNGSYDYTTFTDNSNVAPTLIKFAIPPYAQPTTNITISYSGFESVSTGDYGPANSLLPVTLGSNLEIWTVTTNDAAVINTTNSVYGAYDGTNYLALADGHLTLNLTTVVGQVYSMSYAYRGPGLLDWWPFEGDANDLIGTNNGIISGTLTNLNQFGEVGDCFQFNGVNTEVDFGTNTGNFGTNDFTVDYWMETTSTNPAEVFLEKGSTCGAIGSFWQIQLGGGTNGPGYPSMNVDSSILHGTTSLNDGQWHHLAWVRRGLNLSLYVDGMFNAGGDVPVIGNVQNNQALILGADICSGDGGTNYSGAADELDIWNRALTDVEIAALYRAGANHISKATTESVLPNAEFLINNVVDSTEIATNAAGTNWLTNIVYFTAFSNTTAIVLEGNPLGMLFDDFRVVGPTNFNYVQPEQALAPFTGQNPVGCWTLDVWDTRTDSPLPTDGVLLSWNLQMTISATNVNLIVLTNHLPYNAGYVPSNSIEYFAFDVPVTANYATNTLSLGSTNLTLLYNQVSLPTGSQLGDYALVNNTNAGLYVLTNNAPPPSLVPGHRYFLGVLNNTSVASTFTLRVDTDSNNIVVTPLFDAVALTTNILVSSNAAPYNSNPYATNAPQYFSFVVPENAIAASFEILNPTDQIELYVRDGAPLPSSSSYDYTATYDGTNNEAIVVTTNSYAFTNSMPVPLTPGTWYLAVYDYSTSNTTNAVTYTIEATYITNNAASNAITITPLTDGVPLTNQTANAGPDLTNFYSFTIANNAPGVQFVVTNMTQNVDLISRIGYLPTPQEMTAGSFNPGTGSQLITIITNDTLPSLNGTWYLGTPGNAPTNVTANFTILATTLTNITNIYNFPAVVFSSLAVSAGDSGFSMGWYSANGAEYEVDVTTNFSTWKFLTNITTFGSSATYTDPTPVNAQVARFYRVFRKQ